jgi:hypothetical protein
LGVGQRPGLFIAPAAARVGTSLQVVHPDRGDLPAGTTTLQLTTTPHPGCVPDNCPTSEILADPCHEPRISPYGVIFLGGKGPS